MPLLDYEADQPTPQRFQLLKPELAAYAAGQCAQPSVPVEEVEHWAMSLALSVWQRPLETLVQQTITDYPHRDGLKAVPEDVGEPFTTMKRIADLLLDLKWNRELLMPLLLNYDFESILGSELDREKLEDLLQRLLLLDGLRPTSWVEL